MESIKVTSFTLFWLWFRTVADTLNSWYIVCGHFYRWDLAWGAISNDSWQDSPIHCWQCCRFVTTNNPPGGTYHWLEGLHTGTTPVLMQCTKVSYYTWLWLWSLVVVPSCAKMRHFWWSRGLLSAPTRLVWPFDCNLGLLLTHSIDVT